VRALVLPQTRTAGAWRCCTAAIPRTAAPPADRADRAAAAPPAHRSWCALADRSQAPRYAAATRTHFGQGACFGLASAFQDFLGDAGAAFAPIAQPTLVIWGDRDPSHAATDPEATRAAHPRPHHLGPRRPFPELEKPAE
jgi:pimeloyl-ACP methyl ester carboxylesterase